ncbi:hypothetical protein TNCV_1431031 [Trichonephila clavipes]|nr:hypothetical protein TNCV_1431031 [Trichonephila clavipes]
MVTRDGKWVTYDNIVRKRSWPECSEAAQTVAKPGLTAKKRSKTFFVKQNGGRKEKLSEGDRRVLKSIVRSKKRKTAVKVSTKLNQHPDSPVSMIPIRRHLHEQNIYAEQQFLNRLSPMLMPYVITTFCDVTLAKPGRLINGKSIICSDESSFTFFPTARRLHV